MSTPTGPGSNDIPPPVARLVRAAGGLPEAATFIGAGYGNLAFRIPATGGGDWCLRLPRPESPWAARDLEREVRLLRVLERADFGVAIPRNARVLREGRRLIGTLHRLVEGTPLRERPPHGSRAQAALSRDLASFLSRLHATPVERARRAGVREEDLWRDRYAELVEAGMPHLGPRTQAWLSRTVEAFVSSGGSERGPRVLIHGDISGWHLLMDDDGALSGVIDFGDARIADPALDFAGLLNDLSPRILDQVLAQYTLPLDPDVRRRIAFYIQLAPLFQVVYGETAVGAEERRAGVRALTARAAAAARRQV